MIVFREDDPAFIAARSEEKPPGRKAFASTRSSEVASEQKLAEIGPPFGPLKELASLIADRPIQKVRRWVLGFRRACRQSDAKSSARHSASAAPRRIALQKHFVQNAYKTGILFRGSFGRAWVS